ncbi:hypothetical protein [Streptomyces sp. SPB074]|uniref:hypothetical protein n=1 Tax=Streptomyces sp. (strain SPB074) TaxID=465543 RepID=UPI00017FE74C|nr:hypothetical protein [Streptomyces sp. SPB074]EDY42160.1 conserved hypothetical protein [Streptomyces sp. SPB074]
MPLSPEEPQIPESAQGPSATTAPSRSAQTPRPVPGPRPAAPPRPARPGPPRTASAQREQQPKPPAPAAAQIQLIPSPSDGALDAAEEAVDLLLDSGRAPGEVLVLTTGEAHPWTVHELSFGEAAYWAQQDAGDDVFYVDTAHVARVAARPVVVVALNGGAESTVATVLPFARERANTLLIVCGDPQRVNAVLGAGV